MLSLHVRQQVQNITSGAIITGQNDRCTTIRNLLCSRYPTSTTVKTDFESKSVAKKEQAALIHNYCDENDLWVQPEGDYLTRGGEASVFLHPGKKDVIKTNDAVYYATWLEFLNSILLHNIFFENTAYTLTGFYKENGNLFAVLRQPFIISDRSVELYEIRTFL